MISKPSMKMQNLFLSKLIRLYLKSSLQLITVLYQVYNLMEKEPIPQKKPRVKWINPLKDRTRVIPFVVPDKEERMGALGTLAGEKWRIKKSLLAILDHFDPINAPKPEDNLGKFEQQGQGFGLFASKRRNIIDLEKEIIYICPFFCKVTKESIRRIKKKAKAFFYGAKVKLFELPKPNLNQFDPMEGPNGQKYYDAAKLNTYFAKHLPKNSYTVAIITNLLIYNGDNPVELLQNKWVFGLGAIKDRTCVISYEQMLIKQLGGKRDQNVGDQDEINVEFLQKVVNHQICHTFGMRHCIYHQCLMNGSSGYQEAISKESHLCPVCVRKLQLALGFQFADRYEALGDEKCLMLAQKIRGALTIISK